MRFSPLLFIVVQIFVDTSLDELASHELQIFFVALKMFDLLISILVASNDIPFIFLNETPVLYFLKVEFPGSVPLNHVQSLLDVPHFPFPLGPGLLVFPLPGFDFCDDAFPVFVFLSQPSLTSGSISSTIIFLETSWAIFLFVTRSSA